ncbi:TPA: SemiSWEET family sugar transporter [Streptococcus suis]|nr:SemiSWEET family sugar transporter [Streptococcus suis]HEM3721568.1 SemiSWEET family sugar transporter [Streptococcus suis]
MIGFVAACLTTFGFLPQVIQVVKTKETQAISLGMYSMSVPGIGLWLIHGILIGDAALIVANSISFVLSGIILFYKLRYK